jgi:glycine cleavage system H lipoate-binding protein/ABC-type phosphate transport system substrate-binding protein
MKKSFVFLIGLLLINCGVMSGKAPGTDTLLITSTPDMYKLASTWADEYNVITRGLKVKVVKVSDKSVAEEFIKRGMLGFVTARNYPAIRNESGWNTVVGRDVIVPVVSNQNPVIEKINEQGMTVDEMLEIITNKEGGRWNSVFSDAKNAPVHYYRIKDESIAAALAGFMGSDKVNQAGREVEGSVDLISAIQGDPLGIGFCRLTSVIDMNNQTLAKGLSLLPVDRNSNGTMDYNENIYGNYNQLSRGIWIGKYPKSLCSNIYAAGMKQPEGEASIAFLKWVLTNGQKYLYDSGYSDLFLAERQKAVNQLNETKDYKNAVSETRSPFVALLILFAVALILVITTGQVIKYFRSAKSISSVAIPESDKVFGESAVVVPQGLYFDKTHTWAFMEQNGTVKVGIDDFLQRITGTITRVKMKKDGTKVQKGEAILSIIQNGKHLDLYAPVSGIIKEHNSVLETNSGLINSSPYNDGWIYKIEPSNWHRENQLLFYAEKYRQYLSQEFTRLKDFMSSVLNSGSKEYSHVILQDGGELRDGILSQMGPEVWDDFQTKYIDPSRQIWFYELF